MKVRIEKDSIDLEELKDCVRTRGYALIAEKHAAMLDSLRNGLETARGDELLLMQGQIKALRTCMTLPQIIADEIRSKQRAKSP